MTASSPLPPDFLTLLVCPLTRTPLRQEGDTLVASLPPNAGLRYPIRDGIPIMLVDEAILPEGIHSLHEFRQHYADYIPGSSE